MNSFAGITAGISFGLVFTSPILGSALFALAFALIIVRV
jgi:hypothetical protein